jgi:ATP-dependent DNA helicase RecG
MAFDGPQCVPFYPHEHRSYLSDLGLLDASAQPISGLSLADLDPIEFHRLRQTVVRLRGDSNLVDLDDESLVKALNLVQTQGDQSSPQGSGNRRQA